MSNEITLTYRGTEIIVHYDHIPVFHGSHLEPPHAEEVTINEIFAYGSKTDLIELLDEYLDEIEVKIFEEMERKV